MALQAVKGTHDLLPGEAHFWIHFQELGRKVFGRYGFEPIETPIIERTELFVRGIGTATDVVNKEMYRALSGENLRRLLAGQTLKPTSDLSLRPEGTAGVVRSIIQQDLMFPSGPPVKLCYGGPMFRAENPQAGRQRQFNQIGVECLGSDDPTIDAEGILAAMDFFKALGLESSRLTLLINSMGCSQCRPAYREAVRDFLLGSGDELCDDCKKRADTNPLRAFDCKEESCRRVMDAAPRITDYVCDDCAAHYTEVKALLTSQSLTFVEDSRLVRGLDYYTRTVFEVQCDAGLGSQNALGGGGRYDGLCEELGGKPTPGFGFALGYERCRLALEAQGSTFGFTPRCDIFVAAVTEDERSSAFNLTQRCRQAGFRAEMDHQHRSLKSQFKLANRLGAARVAVIGPDELAQSVCTLRDMDQHSEITASLDEVPTLLASALL